MRVMVALLSAAGVASASASSPSSAVAGPAEYAFRWNPAQAGPASAAAVIAALNLQPGKSKEYVVRYFDVVQPSALPAAYKAIGRERGAPGKVPDATYKLRGPEPIPAELQALACPLTGDSERKAEWDIGFVGTGPLKRVFSVSCTVDKATLPSALPTGYVATAKGCSSRMVRTKARSAAFEVKVEQWSLPTVGTVIEVSMDGIDSDRDRERFRQRVVEPLTNVKAIPLEGSKSELGSDC